MYTKIKAINNGEIMNGINKCTFLAEDTAGVCKEMGYDNIYFAEIYDYYLEDGYTIDQCKEVIKQDIDILTKENPDTVIVTTAYVPLKEFSPEEYYSEDGHGNKNGKPLPVNETLEKYSKMLEELGFVNINNLSCYEMKVAFMYDTEYTRPIIEHIKNM